jgi:protein-tyrosine phosphatase
MPRLCLGAEVAFFEGISQAAQVDRLCLGDTDVLLLEMPFRPWRNRDVDEVEDLLNHRGFRVILAHLERYLPQRENRSLIQELLELPALVQINAESLLEWRGRGRVLRLFREGKAHLLGSDCHGVEFRSPNLGQGRAVLNKKLGPEVLAQIDRTGAGLLPEVNK